ncbi:hypothetical protein [Parafrigoribacterium soli]|uniref:hypothetical protein n=1 Tax=Parafrigoribacterium soli TaxID=3144663 RepID=UPI0032EB433B
MTLGTVGHWLAAATPTPNPDFDPTTVTPTWVGFAVTFLVAVATVLLIMDMVRRVRRVRYRSEVLEKLEAERAAQAGGRTSGGSDEH